MQAGGFREFIHEETLSGTNTHHNEMKMKIWFLGLYC